ncbi:hypothetical protein [Inediibacterium massiliense]|uniref:hypothetical protein n=1 Tax=Inediibacterium massiliense TaxID=1658111 RepID=UPI0006B58571|nr:hypothetical protein [Inediibacterium massiliense]
MNEEIYMKSMLDIPKEIYMEDFTPMEDRLKNTSIEEEFQILKREINPKDFEKYFNTLIQIKKHEKDMLLITHSENYRAIILREYLNTIKKIFHVDHVRILIQHI